MYSLVQRAPTSIRAIANKTELKALFQKVIVLGMIKNTPRVATLINKYHQFKMNKKVRRKTFIMTLESLMYKEVEKFMEL